MALDDLKKLTSGFIKGWKKGKLKETLKETAQLAIDEKVKNAELEEKNRLLQDEIRRLKGEKKKPVIKPKNTKDLNPTPKKPHKKRSKKKDFEIDEVVEVESHPSRFDDLASCGDDVLETARGLEVDTEQTMPVGPGAGAAAACLDAE